MAGTSKTPKQSAGISDAAVAKATGKTWAMWCALLDKAGCRNLTHKEIVAHLVATHDVGPWWRQMVTVGYEQARGLRQKHEVARGFQISRSKTLAVPLARLFAAWTDDTQRGRWLEDPGFTVRKATRNKSLRITWVDGATSLEVLFYTKGAAKSQVAIQHSLLKTAKNAERMKSYWERQLVRLQEYLKK